MKKRVAIVGGGLGGMSAAISLANAGYAVTLCEKNARLGGKLNVKSIDGFSFDLGPSILTLPHIFEALFAGAGRRMSDYVACVPVHPHWRNFFEDGTVFDLVKDRALMSRELTKLPGYHAGLERELDGFLAYSKRQYDIVDRGYFARGLDDVWQFLRFYGFFRLAFRVDHRRTMSEAIRASLSDPHLRDVFEYFIKYVGSSALAAPGFMNLMPTIQFEHDLWYVPGGMYNLARGLEKLAREVGVEIHLGAEVARIETTGGRATGVRLTGGEVLAADHVVSNMEVVPAYERLLGEGRKFLRKLDRFEPACSGLVVHLGTDKVFPALAHHNFFYSKSQREHFDTVFRRGQLPDDPTIYLVAPTRSDPTQAPVGCDNLKILPHIPYLREGGYDRAALAAFQDRVLDKLERMGLDGLRRSIVVEDVWTPFDIEREYYSNRGSIYGVVSDWEKNQGFKAPKRSAKYRNLYFVGGSVNPGGGMPMVALCGQNVAKAIIQDDRAPAPWFG